MNKIDFYWKSSTLLVITIICRNSFLDGRETQKGISGSRVGIQIKLEVQALNRFLNLTRLFLLFRGVDMDKNCGKNFLAIVFIKFYFFSYRNLVYFIPTRRRRFDKLAILKMQWSTILRFDPFHHWIKKCNCNAQVINSHRQTCCLRSSFPGCTSSAAWICLSLVPVFKKSQKQS